MAAKSAPSQNTQTAAAPPTEPEQKSDAAVLDAVLANSIYQSLASKGDLSQLSTEEKTSYMRRLCEAVGLNPLTMPFLPLKLNGKEVFYATRNATDQLTNIHKLTRDIVKTDTVEGVYVVTAKVSGQDGRYEISTGAVPIGSKKGDDLANALMKAETKAKRRGTLSYCGLGFLDESEIETIPVNRVQYPPTKGELTAAAAAASAQQPAAPPVVQEKAADPAAGEAMSVEHSRWRYAIGYLIGLLNEDPSDWLRSFDANESKRQGYYLKVLREFVKAFVVLDRWPYTPEKTAEYFEKFGIVKVDEASIGQLEPLVEQMQEDGLFADDDARSATMYERE